MRTKKLNNLFDGIKANLPLESIVINVSGIEYDSRKIKKGDLFAAVPGFNTDGHNYLEMAAKSGAVCAVVEKMNKNLKLPQVIVKNSRLAMAKIAADFYSPEAESLTLCGITGTNGKTTTSYLVRSIMEEAGLACGIIGTISYSFGGKEVPAWNTTPEAPDIAKILYEAAGQGQKACVLEVSSHALSLNRVDGLKFDAAVFTNISRDHLDFHKTEENYYKAKRKLFSLLKRDGTAVINLDNRFGRRLIKEINRPVLTFGHSKEAAVRVIDENVSITGTRLSVQTKKGEIQIASKLTGGYNIENISAAVAAGLAMNIHPEHIAAGINKLGRVPGRLETYPITGNRMAVIDYAHTPDALEKALQSLRELTSGRLVVVFGAGGGRDKGKRPLMGSIAEKYGDKIIVTSDNPRNEDPDEIIKDITEGMSMPEKYEVIADRRAAIMQTIQNSENGDVILISGKGHETYQEVQGRKYEFNELEIVKEAAEHV